MKINRTKLALALAAKCWTYSDLAVKAALSKNTLYRIANGKNLPTTRTAGKIAKALGIPVSEFLLEDN